MAYSVEQLKGVINAEGGLLKNNLYAVQFPAIKGIAPSALNLLTKNATVPGRQVNTVERNVGGFRSRVGTGNLTDDITMTFQLTNSDSVQAYFENWMKVIYDKNTRRVGYFRDYAKIITIKELSLPQRDLSRPIAGNSKLVGQLGRFLPDAQLGPINASLATNTLSLDFGQNTVRTITLENAYPFTMNPIEFSDAGEGFAELTMSFTFSEWYSKPGLGAKLAGLVSF